VGEAVLGRTPRSVWGLIALAVAIAALALSASPARGTTDRIDYADQANPICASTNKQVVQLYEAVEAEIERLERLDPKNKKKARRLRERAYRLYEQLPFQYLVIYRAELAQLKAIAAPPGYEDTVARWLGVRERIAALYQQYLEIEELLEGPIGFVGKKPTRKTVKRALKRARKLRERQEQIEQQFLSEWDLDLELGAKMGAAYCVTGATGDVSTNFIGSDD
jgi:hypothetical protein